MQQNPELEKIHEEMKQELSFETAKYEESLARTGEPVPPETVENIDVLIDAPALAAYA